MLDVYFTTSTSDPFEGKKCTRFVFNLRHFSTIEPFGRLRAVFLRRIQL